MNTTGQILLHRKIFEWGWYQEINTCRLFIHMCLKANWKDGKFKDISVPRGSFVSSIEKLSEETSLTAREVRTAISHLKSTGEVTVKTTNRYSVFTVQNYNLYQTLDIQKDEQETNRGLSNDFLTTTIDIRDISNKELLDDNVTKDNIIICPEPKKSAPNTSGIKLVLNDKTFYDVPFDKIALWRETYPAVNIEYELQKMRAWLDSNPTRRKTRRGIERFINNWLSRTQDSAKPQVVRENKGGDIAYAEKENDGRSFAL